MVERTRNLGLVASNICTPSVVSLLDRKNTAKFIETIRNCGKVLHQFGCTKLGILVEEINWHGGKNRHEYLLEESQREIRQRQQDNFVHALKQVAPIAESEGIVLVTECQDTLVDHVDYFLTAWEQGVDIVREVDSPAVLLTFDAYHHQINEGNLIDSITKYTDLVGHIHIADVPGRHEPGTGEINFLNLLLAAKRAGYEGYIGLECAPTTNEQEALAPIMKIVEEVNRT